MGVSPHLVVLAVAVAAFVLLLMRERRDCGVPATGKAAGIAFAALAAIDIAGAIGVAWFAIEVLFYDIVMVEELLICAALLAILALFTGGGFAARRRGRIRIAIALLAIAAVPTIALFGFLVYLDNNPIDMK